MAVPSLQQRVDSLKGWIASTTETKDRLLRQAEGLVKEAMRLKKATEEQQSMVDLFEIELLLSTPLEVLGGADETTHPPKKRRVTPRATDAFKTAATQLMTGLQRLSPDMMLYNPTLDGDGLPAKTLFFNYLTYPKNWNIEPNTAEYTLYVEVQHLEDKTEKVAFIEREFFRGGDLKAARNLLLSKAHACARWPDSSVMARLAATAIERGSIPKPKVSTPGACVCEY